MIRRALTVFVLAITALSVSAGTGTADTQSLDRKPAPPPVTQAVAAVEPTMYPPAEKVKYLDNGVRGHRCETGTLCVDAWDPTRNTYKVFIMRKCVTRSLHHFSSTGLPEFVNHQTPHTVTRFLRRDGSVGVSSTAPSYVTSIDWGPIWYIDVC